MTTKELEFTRFKNNVDNAYKCSRCPLNEGIGSDTFDVCYPCGEQICWVQIHAEREDYQEVEKEY